MGGFLSEFSGTERIDVSDLANKPLGTWYADVKKSLSDDEYAPAKRTLGGPKGTDFPAFQRALLMAAIVDWNLTDEDDRRLPLFPPEDKYTSIIHLPNVVTVRLFTWVNDHNRDRTEEEQATFRSGTDEVNGVGGSGATGTPVVPPPPSAVDESGA